jgi:hypothetical protein
VESFAERPAKNAGRADAAAWFGSGWSNRSASRGIHPEQTNRQSEREYATAEQTNASHVSAARSMMMRRCGITDSSEAISYPANFAESSISTLSHFLNLSVARHAFLNCARSFFEIGA